MENGIHFVSASMWYNYKDSLDLSIFCEIILWWMPPDITDGFGSGDGLEPLQ